MGQIARRDKKLSRNTKRSMEKWPKNHDQDHYLLNSTMENPDPPLNFTLDSPIAIEMSCESRGSISQLRVKFSSHATKREKRPIANFSSLKTGPDRTQRALSNETFRDLLAAGQGL